MLDKMDENVAGLHPNFRQAVHDVLKQWHLEGGDSSPLQGTFLFRQLYSQGADSGHQVGNRLLLQALQLLEEQFPQEALLLRRSYVNNELDRTLVQDLNIGESTLYRRKDAAVARLTQIVVEMEQAAVEAYRSTMLDRIESASYTHLVGIETHLARLSPVFTSQDSPWLVAFSGMGGIGKTTLAHALVRTLIEEGTVEELGWVTARTQAFHYGVGIAPVEKPTLTTEALFGALAAQLLGDANLTPEQAEPVLRRRLKERPHLIVIDNLETLEDTQELLQMLQQLMNPTRFLLTSRASLYAEPNVFAYPVPELSMEHVLAFIRQEARLRNLTPVVDADDQALQPIYETVGGNPLAIRLVVGQLHVHALDTVLDNLQQARGQKSEALYTYIYRHAWEQLDELSRRALLAMQLVTSFGATAAQLGEISRIEPDDLVDALERLAQLSLIDSSRSLNERRYTIHGLTRTFLREQVLHWQ